MIFFFFFINIYSFVNIQPPLWSYATTRGHGLNKRESTLPENATKQVSSLLVSQKKIFKDIPLYIPLLKLDIPLCPNPTPADLNVNILNSTQPNDATPQVKAFLVDWFLSK